MNDCFSILLDFDGTLINNKGQIEKNDLAIFKDLTKNNHICVVSNTNYTGLKEFKKKYDINIDIVSTSSGVAEINNKLITNMIPKVLINTLLTEFEDIIYTAFGESLEKSFIYKYKERLDLLYPKKERVIDKNLTFDLTSITFALSIYRSNEFIDKIDDLGLGYTIISKDKNRIILNIFRNSMSKADAYYLIKNEYNDKKIIGVSDSYYDIDMISKCDIKIAMLNSDSELKAISDYITEYTNNEGGAIKLLDNICHLK